MLHINASAQTDASRSRKMSQHIVDHFLKQSKGKVITRDLNLGIPHVDQTWVGATFTPIENRNQDQTNKLNFSKKLVSELQAADTIVIGTPIYNFNIPASFKAWIDMIARVGLTFKYTQTGPVGLLENKKVIIAIASGGTTVGSDNDFASNYLKHIFAFIGINDTLIIDTNKFNIEAENIEEQTEIQKQLNEIFS